MKIKTKPKRTKSYVMTMYPEDLYSQYVLKNLRTTVSMLNKHIDSQYYVKCHGRFGKNNPNLHKYTSASGRVNYRECRLGDAERRDVYIYRR